MGGRFRHLKNNENRKQSLSDETCLSRMRCDVALSKKTYSFVHRSFVRSINRVKNLGHFVGINF